MRYLILFSFLALVGSGCTLQQGTYDKKYVDIDSLIKKQVVLLTPTPVKVEKRSRLGAHESVSNTTLDSLSVVKELEVFQQLDAINKPGFREAYLVETTPDTKSNLTIRSYVSLKPAAIPFVKLYYLHDPSNLKKMEARIEENNALFSSARDLQMEFEEHNQRPRLVSYRLEGVQKMALRDTVRYSVETQIIQ